MTSAFETLLEQHSRQLHRKWRQFARRGPSEYAESQTAWWAHAHGFKLAADALAKDCYENHPGRRVLKAPIFFLYRHFVELSLKSTWKDHQQRGWIRANLEPRHDVVRLWNEIKRVLFAEGIVTVEDDLMRAVEKSFKLIDEIDRSSTHSRYPEDLKGDRHAIDFNLEELVLAMEDMDTLFFGLSAMLDLHDDYLSDMAQSTF